MNNEGSSKRSATDAQGVSKPIHTILLDTSPILLNTPSISTLLANSHTLVTTQSVLDEVRGEEARNRVETLYKPFLTIRSAKPESIKFVKEFARKTGDGGVLSTTDFEILALAYDLECEKNGGDWRLRSAPGQKRLNGSPPVKDDSSTQQSHVDEESGDQEQLAETLNAVSINDTLDTSAQDAQSSAGKSVQIDDEVNDQILDVVKTQEGPTVDTITEAPSSDSEEDGWITPSNIKNHQMKDEAGSNTTKTEIKTLQVATMTGDFAMQNVLLQMNLNLLSTKTCKRITNIKQMIFRCHACFATTKDMSKQFCPRCGGPTLTRVTCTTNDKGEVKLHLKANHQWNNRGNVFSVPKPTSGTANQKWQGPQQGGGKGGWGNGLILTEDQKEYARAVSQTKRTKNKDLMDEDVLPSILTGDRDRGGGRIRVGAGRNINSRKR